MEAPAVGAVVLLPFPFSDLSQAKFRPAIVLANVGRGDYVLCQVTSNPYADPFALELTHVDFAEGSLKRISYARPGKLFTANQRLMTSQSGVLASPACKRIVQQVIGMLQAGV